MNKLNLSKVHNFVQFKEIYIKVVQEIVQGRISSGQTQKDVADWIKVERRRIIQFEKKEKIDIELFLLLADKFDIEFNISIK